jgi:hypothetical protein
MPFRSIADPEVRQAASNAYAKALARLGIDGSDPQSSQLAFHIIACAGDGDTDADKLADRAVMAFRSAARRRGDGRLAGTKPRTSA